MTSSADSRARAVAPVRGSRRRLVAGRSDRRTSSGERPDAGANAAAWSASPETTSIVSGALADSPQRGRPDRSGSAVLGASVAGGPRARAEARRSRVPWSPASEDEARRPEADSGPTGSRAARTRTSSSESGGRAHDSTTHAHRTEPEPSSRTPHAAESERRDLRAQLALGELGQQLGIGSAADPSRRALVCSTAA